MPLGIGAPKTFAIARREKRVLMEVGVQISGHASQPGIETTFTENVSSRGARVLSSRRWKTNDNLTIATSTGSFQSLARVAYCQGLSASGYAIGLELMEPGELWVVAAPGERGL